VILTDARQGGLEHGKRQAYRFVSFQYYDGGTRNGLVVETQRYPHSLAGGHPLYLSPLVSGGESGSALDFL